MQTRTNLTSIVAINHGHSKWQGNFHAQNENKCSSMAVTRKIPRTKWKAMLSYKMKRLQSFTMLIEKGLRTKFGALFAGIASGDLYWRTKQFIIVFHILLFSFRFDFEFDFDFDSHFLHTENGTKCSEAWYCAWRARGTLSSEQPYSEPAHSTATWKRTMLHQSKVDTSPLMAASLNTCAMSFKHFTIIPPILLMHMHHHPTFIASCVVG